MVWPFSAILRSLMPVRSSDPLVAGVDELFKVMVGDDLFRCERPGSCYPRMDHLALRKLHILFDVLVDVLVDLALREFRGNADGILDRPVR